MIMDNALLSKTPLSLTIREELSRKLIFKLLSKLSYGSFTLIEGDVANQNKLFFGQQGQTPHAEIFVKNSAFYTKVLFAGSIGAGESFIDGDWDSPDVTQFIYLFALNLPLIDKIERYFNWLSLPVKKITQLLNRNTHQGAKKNILAHYDIGNDFYETFLDKEMLYSSAIYSSIESNLAEAQQYKLKLICEKLNLQAGQSLLEIGTGWGALAIYAAKHYGVKVTTTTISNAQFEYAKKRIEAENLTDKIRLLNQDYRQLKGTYDRIVSIEMIEAVGHEYMAVFFKKINSLLKPNGKMLIQGITITDQHYDTYRKNIDFIQKYIFPGGCLPSICVLANHLKTSTQLSVWSIDDIGQDYAKTLAHWRENFIKSISTYRQRELSNEFINMWLFYFHYCEAGFLARTISAIHLVAVGPQYNVNIGEHD